MEILTSDAAGNSHTFTSEELSTLGFTNGLIVSHDPVRVENDIWGSLKARFR